MHSLASISVKTPAEVHNSSLQVTMTRLARDGEHMLILLQVMAPLRVPSLRCPAPNGLAEMARRCGMARAFLEKRQAFGPL